MQALFMLILDFFSKHIRKVCKEAVYGGKLEFYEIDR